MTARWSGLSNAGYALALLLPVIGIGVMSRGEIATWLATGTCPGGAMDRPAALCGPLEFFGVVFLGGWAAFIVVPVLVAWWLACTGAWRLAVTHRQRAVH